MNKLCCDICGGALMMQSGGQTAICDSCGMQYSVERVREKVQEITGTVRVDGAVATRQTGTIEDVEQWRMLVRKYYNAGDFQAAEQIVKKILEAVPADIEANKMYDELQVLKFMEIKNGVLVKYTGLAETLTIPNCVKEIGERAFEYHKSLKHVSIPTSVITIGNYAFYATDLKSIQIPSSVTTIGTGAFDWCGQLESVRLPVRFNFTDCESIFGHDDEWGYSPGSPWYTEYRKPLEKNHIKEGWKKRNCCQYCGSEFSKGIWGPIRCKKCGREKDY